jgi:hypothetical protein
MKKPPEGGVVARSSVNGHQTVLLIIEAKGVNGCREADSASAAASSDLPGL